MALAHHCAVFTCTYYLANVILFNEQYFQIIIICNMCSIIPKAWNIHTVIAMFQHELFVHALRRCHVLRITVLRLPLFTYYLAHR